MRSVFGALAAGLAATASAQAICYAANGMDLIFVLDESGSVGHTDYAKAKEFVKDVSHRFKVGTGASDTRVAYLSFAKEARTVFDLYEYDTPAAVDAGISAATFSGGGTCTGLAMRMVSDDILETTNAKYRPNSEKIVIFITDGNPSQISYCDTDYSFSTGYSYTREALIKVLKAKADRIVPVGVGRGVATGFLQSLSHNMPSGRWVNGVWTTLPNYVSVSGGYSDMTSILDTLATVACPTAPPTDSKAPTGAPTFIPTSAPTYSCTNGCTADNNGQSCDAVNGFCYFIATTCLPADQRCGCNGARQNGVISGSGTQAVCTFAPSAAPTTAQPSVAPTARPSFAPTVPTKAPTYWDLFNSGEDSQADAAAKTAAGVAGAGLGALAIVAIILGVIAAIVLIAMIAGGVGIFAARKKLFATDITVDGKQLQKGNAISVGQKIEMTEATAGGMLERGEITPEQFAEMGFSSDGGGDALPSYADAR